MVPPPPLPYAPKRKRPLSLLNPLDYLILLSWVFTFPQALRWHVETFGTLSPRTVGWEAMRHDPVQRALAFQGFFLLVWLFLGAFVGVTGLAAAVNTNGPVFDVRVLDVISGVFVGMVVGWLGGVVAGLIWGVPVGVAVSVGGSVPGGLVGGIVVLLVALNFGSADVTGNLGLMFIYVITYMALGGALGGLSGLVIGFLAYLVRGLLARVQRSSTTTLPHSFTFGLVGGVAGGIVIGVVVGVVVDIQVLKPGFSGTDYTFLIGVLISLAFGVGWGVAVSVYSGVPFGGVTGVADAVTVVAALLVGTSVAGLLPTTLGGMGGPPAVGIGVIFGLALLRLGTVPLSLLGFVPGGRRVALTLQRSSPVPIAGLYTQLARQLAADWARGIDEAEGLLRYRFQFIPVFLAIRQVLYKETPPDLLLRRISAWCSHPLYDWTIVRLMSARPGQTVLRSDTPVRAACAGFWHLHRGDADAAARAFAAPVARSLPQGEELYGNAAALAAAAASTSLDYIARWKPPAPVRGDLLRPAVRSAFDALALIVQDVALVHNSRSARQRSSALARALAALNDPPSELRECPPPEGPLIEQIRAQWLQTVLDNAGAVTAVEQREPVPSPYIVGAIVPANRLVGRDDIFSQIKGMWVKPGHLDSLVMYGHRRMGKSSIVRGLQEKCDFGDHTGLVVLNLQTVDWTQDLSDLCYAIALALWGALPTPLVEPQPEDYEQHALRGLRDLLIRFSRMPGDNRYILILDEYELLDQKLSEAEANEFVAALRGFTQDFPWLVIGLVGLHTLQERSADFYQAIYAWRPLKIGLMGREGVSDLLQVPDDMFPLEYSPEALDLAYTLTGGQPFLVELLGDRLVQHFNEQLRVQLEAPPPTFTAADVTTVVDVPQFYEQGNAYFRGIWEQAGETPLGQQAILRALAMSAQGMPPTVLQQAAGLPPSAFPAALKALCDHDVVICADSGCRYTVELMRRWLVQQTPALAEPGSSS